MIGIQNSDNDHQDNIYSHYKDHIRKYAKL